MISMISDVVFAQNAPVTTAATLSTAGSSIIIPVTVADFKNISSCNLVLEYDPGIATAISVSTGPSLEGSLNTDLSIPGTISLGWYIYPGLTLPGEPVLFNIAFNEVSSGTTSLTWFDDGYSCVFYDGDHNLLNDLPTGTYYISGSLTFITPVGMDQANRDDDQLKITVSPNPFSGNMNVTYFLPETGHVSLEVRNMLGEAVTVPVDEIQGGGIHSLRVGSNGLRPGIYMVSILLRTNSRIMSRCIKVICY